jgi:hypothetical protein
METGFPGTDWFTVSAEIHRFTVSLAWDKIVCEVLRGEIITMLQYSKWFFVTRYHAIWLPDVFKISTQDNMASDNMFLDNTMLSDNADYMFFFLINMVSDNNT